MKSYKYIITVLTASLLTGNVSMAQDYSKNIFEGHNDVGVCKLKGDLHFMPTSQEYILTGSGDNIWFGEDQFHYAWKKLSGDFILRADISFIGEGSHEHRKAGWMIRRSLDSGSPHISGTVHGDGLTSLQYRTAEGAETSERKSPVTAPDVIQLERRGDKFIFSCAVAGNPFDTLMITTGLTEGEVYAGLFICSHDNSVSESARFTNVRIIRPANDDFVPYRDYLGSNLEIMDVETGHRNVVFQAPNSIQAPNWTPDGKYLIYNSEGLLYRFDIATGKPELINSGFATRNNNDHVLSFDGKMLGISHHVAEDENKSIIFTMPVGGGTPVRITANGPSYLHGWSPDGRYLTYTAERGGNYDIYKIAIKKKKKEIRLTDAPGLDDGSEYSPDGRYIYFNSARTGTMQLWRMKPDGSDQEQLTFDSFNDWFPHISPDGKHIIFLSFLPDVRADDHPFYKHVYIRKMPADGGTPEVVAYLYGGQGSINVPSWSPDSKQIAFVSNTGTLEPLVAMTGGGKKMDMSLLSPGGDIRVTVNTDNDGFALYSVYYRDTAVIENGRLGLIRPDGDFSTRLTLDSVSDLKTVNGSYTLTHGKTREADYKAMRRTYHFTGISGESMEIVFQVSDDGVAFCYSFPGPSEGIKNISVEKTTFSFVAGTRAWIQPRAAAKSGWNQSNPSYEEHYLEEVSLEAIAPDSNGYVFPALFRTANCWVNLTESWPDRNYCGSHLGKGEGANEMVIAFPEPSEGFTGGTVYPGSSLPWTTPWRIITMGGTPGVIVESTHGTDLAKAPAGGDFSYVRPGRAAWSWALMKDQSVNFEVQKEFINYASEMGWEYCLIDVNWDITIGWEKIADLAAMASRKNVGLILWYNSAGDWNTVPYHPKDKLLTHESRITEFARLEALGIKGIKVDFFGGDGQSMMDYYQDLLADAHEYRLMVNCHGSTLPRGLHRTWPNLVAMEAVRGLEFATFEQESANKVPSKATTLAFTRNAFDPMDFTPVCFTEYDNFERVTGNGTELAMAVMFLSGVQHYAETPRGMSGMPDYVKVIMGDIPVAWDETRFVDGYPGRYLVIARLSGTTWYVAGINAEKESQDLNLHLSFIANSDGIIITENDTPRSFRKEVAVIDTSGNFTVKMEPNGGFVIKFENTLNK